MGADICLNSLVLIDDIGLGRGVPFERNLDALLLQLGDREVRSILHFLVPGMDQFRNENESKRLGRGLDQVLLTAGDCRP